MLRDRVKGFFGQEEDEDTIYTDVVAISADWETNQAKLMFERNLPFPKAIILDDVFEVFKYRDGGVWDPNEFWSSGSKLSIEFKNPKIIEVKRLSKNYKRLFIKKQLK